MTGLEGAFVAAGTSIAIFVAGQFLVSNRSNLRQSQERARLETKVTEQLGEVRKQFEQLPCLKTDAYLQSMGALTNEVKNLGGRVADLDKRLESTNKKLDHAIEMRIGQ